MIFGCGQLVLFFLVGSLATGVSADSLECGRTLNDFPGPFAFDSRYVTSSGTEWVASGSGTISIRNRSDDEKAIRLNAEVDFNSIFVANHQFAYAVGSESDSFKTVGKVFATKDGGQSWKEQMVNVDAELNRITCVDHLNCWVVGNDGIVLRTLTGGEKWDAYRLDTKKDLFAVAFVSLTAGWIAGSDGLVMKTLDGGATWKQEKGAMFSANTQSEKHAIVWRGISFRNASSGCIAGHDRITCTVDGGQNWSRTAFRDKKTRYNFISFAFYPDKIRALEECGRDFESLDSGKSWQPVA